jgi:hypothetical protein
VELALRLELELASSQGGVGAVRLAAADRAEEVDDEDKLDELDEEESPRISDAMLALFAAADRVDELEIPALESYQAFSTEERLIEPMTAASKPNPQTPPQAARPAFRIA